MSDLLDRLRALPRLGLGVSTEYGAGRQQGALDPLALRARRPDYAGFLEVGVEVVKGLDAEAQAWAARGLPTTYHFLDINLDDPDDFDPAWLDAVRSIAAVLKPAWICGDAGLWHLGRRDRDHGMHEHRDGYVHRLEPRHREQLLELGGGDDRAPGRGPGAVAGSRPHRDRRELRQRPVDGKCDSGAVARADHPDPHRVPARRRRRLGDRRRCHTPTLLSLS